MDVKFPNPLGRRGKLSNISYLTLIVLVKRADHYSDTVRTSDFFFGGGRDKMPQCANLRFDESQPYTSHHNQLIIHDKKDDLHHSLYTHAHTIPNYNYWYETTVVHLLVMVVSRTLDVICCERFFSIIYQNSKHGQTKPVYVAAAWSTT